MLRTVWVGISLLCVIAVQAYAGLAEKASELANCSISQLDQKFPLLHTRKVSALFDGGFFQRPRKESEKWLRPVW